MKCGRVNAPSCCWEAAGRILTMSWGLEMPEPKKHTRRSRETVSKLWATQTMRQNVPSCKKWQVSRRMRKGGCFQQRYVNNALLKIAGFPSQMLQTPCVLLRRDEFPLGHGCSGGKESTEPRADTRLRVQCTWAAEMKAARENDHTETTS